jgi:hypothetical protein
MLLLWLNDLSIQNKHVLCHLQDITMYLAANCYNNTEMLQVKYEVILIFIDVLGAVVVVIGW